eukprot:evm.model.scf_34EXC.1 EVM.evm.TU.scf_34EXC.1   scf_34EXC:10044-17158(+)
MRTFFCVFAASVYDVIQHYEIGEDVGYGGYAVVKKGRDKSTGDQVAIKIVDKTKYDPGDDRLEHEINVLLQISHQRCIQVYDVFVSHQKVFIVTEFVTGGEVLDRLQRLGPYSEKAASVLIRDVIEGVAYLHAHGVVHRDLKLENLLLIDESLESKVKIADFGLSKFFGKDETVLATMCGSPEYVAPEVLGVDEFSDHYTPAVDMWSIGVVLYAMMCCYTPFYDDNQTQMYRNITLGRWNKEDPNWKRLSPQLKDLITRLLKVDQNARLTAERALDHPWVKGTCFAPNEPLGPGMVALYRGSCLIVTVARDGVYTCEAERATQRSCDGQNVCQRAVKGMSLCKL